MTHEELEEYLYNEKQECRNEFMSQKSYYRSVLTAIVALLSLVGGALLWATNISSDTGSLKSGVNSNTSRIEIIEKDIRQNHREQMYLLKEIKERVDR